MSKKRKRPKPVGSIKRVSVVNTPSGMPLVMPMQVFSFPTDKDAAEEVAMKALFDELAQGYVQYQFESFCRRPREDGPDFDAIWDGKAAFVELTELAPLCGPYATAQRVFTVREMADGLVALVRKKNQKYKTRGYYPIFLLIYITDDAFYVAEEVLLVVAHMLQVGEAIVFEAVFLVSFWADGKPHMRMPYPHQENLLLLNIAPLLQMQVINPDSQEARVISKDPHTNSIVIRQFLPEGAEISKLVDSTKATLPGLEKMLQNEE